MGTRTLVQAATLRCRTWLLWPGGGLRASRRVQVTAQLEENLTQRGSQNPREDCYPSNLVAACLN